jgi:hypothetical protein
LVKKKNYILRHHGEKWGIRGINTAGFWSRWLLWNKPSIRESANDIERRFKIKIVASL